MNTFEQLQTCFDWDQIICKQFNGILWYNSKTKVYKFHDKIIPEDDIRLIEYKKSIENLKPLDIYTNSPFNPDIFKIMNG